MQITKLVITLHQRHYDCINSTRNYNYKQLSILINLTIKLYNRTHYLHITENTHAAKGMLR
jgi:hypothetical protein